MPYFLCMFPSTLRLFCHKWGDPKEKKTRERLRTSLFKANEAVLTFHLYFKSSPYRCTSVYASLTVSRNLSMSSLFCKNCLFLSSPSAARAQPLLASTLSELSMAGRAASLRLSTREDALRQLVAGGHVGHGGHDGHGGMVKWWL